MKLSIRLTRNRLSQTLRWIGLAAVHGKPLGDEHRPDRFEAEARRVAQRGFGGRL
jgi:hypothetical protein